MLCLCVIPLVLLFIFFFPKKKRNLIVFALALFINSYFFIPALLEGSLTHATTVAKEYAYVAHFLCPWQLWTANGWLFGDSIPGCGDTMSFKVGKIQLILAGVGLLALLAQILFKKKITSNQRALLLIALFSLGAFFLTVMYSQFIWDLFSPVMALFQFPWRFIVFGIFGVATFAGYLGEVARVPFRSVIVVGLVFVLFFTGRKYFIKPLIPFAEYQQAYNSDEYLHKEIAYKMKEYLVAGADYTYWSSLNPGNGEPVQVPFDYTQPIEFVGRYGVEKNSLFEKKIVFVEPEKVLINIHYFPFWKIYLNNQEILPREFDNLARPTLFVNQGDVLVVRYEQTLTEKLSNILSLIGVALLVISTRDLARNRIP
jgi:hypothetical protein